MPITVNLADEDDERAVQGLGLGRHVDLFTSLAKAREASLDPASGHPEFHAKMAVTYALHLAAELVGPETLKLAYGDDPPEDAPREDALRALMWRLIDLEAFYFWPGGLSSSSSIRAATDELAAIINGDAPRLFAPLRGGSHAPVNAYRLARHQLRALEWGLFLKRHWGRGSAKRSEDAVLIAYGHEKSPWDTIRKWRAPVIDRLGVMAERVLRDAEEGPPPYFRFFKDDAEIMQALERDGKAYQKESRAHLSVVPESGK